MSELSTHLMDHVVPDVPLRQFVLTLPFALRLLVARDRRLLAAVRTVFLRAVSGFIRKKARDRGLFLHGQWTVQDDAGLQLSMEAMKVPAAPDARQAACNASNVRGYNLHAQTRVSAQDEAARLRLLRYVLRPAIAQDRLHFDDGLVTFTMKRVFSDGSRVLRFTPQAFIRRVAMLIPPPRQHEITYVGLLAANAKHRKDIVRVPTHRRVPRVRGDESVAREDPKKPSTPLCTMTWAQLLKRTFAFDVLHCERCGGRARVIAAITDRATIDKILTHLHTASSGNPAAARAPPPAPSQALLL